MLQSWKITKLRRRIEQLESRSVAKRKLDLSKPRASGRKLEVFHHFPNKTGGCEGCEAMASDTRPPWQSGDPPDVHVHLVKLGQWVTGPDGDEWVEDPNQDFHCKLEASDSEAPGSDGGKCR